MFKREIRVINESGSLFGDDEVELSLSLRESVVVLVGEVQQCQEAQCGTDKAVALQEVTVYVGKLNTILPAAFDMRTNHLLSLSYAAVTLDRRPSALISLATQVNYHSLLPRIDLALWDVLCGHLCPGLKILFKKSF